MPTLVIDVEKAVELVSEYQAAADELDRRRAQWTAVSHEVEHWLGDQHSVGLSLRSIAQHLQVDSDDLANRTQMIAFGPDGLQLALWAIDVLQLSPEAWNGDDIVSRRDLESFVTRSDDLGAAARILLTNRSVLTMLDTAANNDNYLADPFQGFHASGGDGRISVADMEAFKAKVSAYATLLPYLALVDTAAQGDPSKADGFLSRADFESIAVNTTLPPAVRQAATAVISHNAYHKTDGFGWDEVGFIALEVASLVPVVGDVVDLTRALYALSQGNYREALIYGIRVAPGVSGATTTAIGKMVEMGRRRAFKDMGKFVALETSKKAGKRLRTTIPKTVVTTSGIDEKLKDMGQSFIDKSKKETEDQENPSHPTAQKRPGEPEKP